MKLYRRANWRSRAVMALYHLGKVIDAVVFFLTLSLVDLELGFYVIMNERLDNWAKAAAEE